MSCQLGEYFWGLSQKKKEKVQTGGQDAVQGDVVSAFSLLERKPPNSVWCKGRDAQNQPTVADG